MTFSAAERNRYARHLSLEGFGEEAQERLRASRVLVVGCGGVGSPALCYLAAAGVGTLGFADGDIVDITNLQRQIIHSTPDIGRLKSRSAEARLRSLNPHVALQPHPVRVTEDNAADIFADYDLILDAVDNYEAKFLLNDTCVALGKPFIHTGLGPWTGQLLTVVPGVTPCLRCICPDMPPERRGPGGAPPGGPVSPIPGVIGALQAMEAIRFLAGLGPTPDGKLRFYDALSGAFETFAARRDPHCPACGSLPAKALPKGG